MAAQDLQQAADRARAVFLGPTREMTYLNVELFEKLADLQINSFKQIADIGLGRARSALDVRDMDSLQGYLREQGDAANAVGRQIQEDAGKLMGIGQEYARKAGEVVQNRIQGAAGAAGTGERAG